MFFEQPFAKVLLKVFTKCLKVFAKFCKFFEVLDLLGPAWPCLGCVWIHLDAFGGIRTRSENFENSSDNSVCHNLCQVFEELLRNERHQQVPASCRDSRGRLATAAAVAADTQRPEMGLGSPY